MARTVNQLSDRKVRSLVHPGRHADGLGLYLAISKAGSRAWVFLYRRGGRRIEMGLGSVDAVPLADARRKARDARAQLADGKDPLTERRVAMASFKEFSGEQILQALDSDDGSSANPSAHPHIAEFDMMATGAPVIGSDGAGSFFYGETLPRDTLNLQSPWDAFLQGVVRVHRLREVTCLYGFTRLEPPPTPAESELDEIQLAVGGADLARNVEWLPAIEQLGEGIFLHVAPEFIQAWLDFKETDDMARNLRDRERRDAARFNREPSHRGIAYWALHSLSHAFMAELALECGYPLSSLKERIYSSGPAQTQRFGILIYTSTAGGQGTLGGLSYMAERAGDLLNRATRRLALCSNDPICAEHSDGSEEYPLQGAACHACLLVPETSCEARNTRLDRGLLTRTVLGGGAPLLG